MNEFNLTPNGMRSHGSHVLGLNGSSFFSYKTNVFDWPKQSYGLRGVCSIFKTRQDSTGGRASNSRPVDLKSILDRDTPET